MHNRFATFTTIMAANTDARDRDLAIATRRGDKWNGAAAAAIPDEPKVAGDGGDGGNIFHSEGVHRYS